MTKKKEIPPAQAAEIVATIQSRSKELGTDKISMKEIDAEIKVVRKKRRAARATRG